MRALYISHNSSIFLNIAKSATEMWHNKRNEPQQ